MNLLPIVIFLLLPLLVYTFISPKANIFGRVISIVNTDNARDIFLTFDDGPNGIWTEGVLEVLDRFNVKATFFLIRKNVEKYP
ncbi:MAG TPA: glycosyl transferase, partial [Nitrospirae bacterium]|nr:glycosyl transferase [Nitrospirota bacterium]